MLMIQIQTFLIIIQYSSSMVIQMINLEIILHQIKTIGHIVGNHVLKVMQISQVVQEQIKIQEIRFVYL